MSRAEPMCHGRRTPLRNHLGDLMTPRQERRFWKKFRSVHGTIKGAHCEYGGPSGKHRPTPRRAEAAAARLARRRAAEAARG